MIIFRVLYATSVIAQLPYVFAWAPSDIGYAAVARSQLTRRAGDECPPENAFLLCSECGGLKAHGKCKGTPPNSNAKDCDCIDDSDGEPEPYIPYDPADLDKISKDWKGLPDVGKSQGAGTSNNPAPDDLKCHGVSGDKWINSGDKALDSAKTFCGQGDKSQEYTDKKRGQPHLDDARLSLSNTDQGKSIKDAPDCLGHFTTVINSCDGNDPVNNPHNYKFGGTLTTSDGWEYKVDPLAHKENGDTCDVSYKVAYDQFEIRGKNWPDAELGANGEGLRAQISGCDGLLKWNFEWTPSDCCYQWFANGQTLAGKKTCIGHAVKTAGGSTTDNCHGAG